MLISKPQSYKTFHVWLAGIATVFLRQLVWAYCDVSVLFNSTLIFRYCPVIMLKY